MVDLNDKQILAKLKERLDTLLKDEAKAETEREKRAILIRKAKLAIDLFSDSETSEENVKSYVVSLPEVHYYGGGQMQKDGESSLNGFDYSNGKTWKDKIKNYLTYTTKPATISELVDEFHKHEPSYSKERINGAMNNAIHAMVKKGALKIYTPPIKMKGYYYANPLWFDGDVLKEEHTPDFKKKLAW